MFQFVDLFAGVGGFHAVGSGLGGTCVYAVENDRDAASVYALNWGLDPLGDITEDANDSQMRVPDHDVLFAGFPCQPFSKSGAQRGMEETRGTLYWNILKIIEQRRPSLVFLENVRNIAGPRHRHEWQIIIETLRAHGYRVSEMPQVFSPHLLPPDLGGRPQVRERVFITATLLPEGHNREDLMAPPAVTNKPVAGWDPQTWDLQIDLLDEHDDHDDASLSETEMYWIDAWDDFVRRIWVERKRRLPGFPLWADEWVLPGDLTIPEETPKWKRDYLIKNAEFYAGHKSLIDVWTETWGIYTDLFPPSRRKLEWQAQDTKSLWDCVMHLRPSGIRAKAPTYVPALVAITQTSILGPRGRRLSWREAKRLQSLPEWFSFDGQTPKQTFKQLGNGVSVGAVWYVLRQHASRDEQFLKQTNPELLHQILTAPQSPDSTLAALRR